MKTFFEQNGVIEYSALGKMQVRDPKAYLEQTYPGNLALVTIYMKRSLLEAAEIELDETSSNGGAFDLRGAFPMDLTDEDLEQLLQASLLSSPQVWRLCLI